MGSNETNISVQFNDSPFDVEIIASWLSSNYRYLTFERIVDSNNKSQVYKSLMKKHDIEQRIFMIKHKLDDLSSRVINEIKFNSSVKHFTNQTQRINAEAAANDVIEWLKENDDEVDIKIWEKQLQNLKLVIDPIYHRLEENITYNTYMAGLTSLLEDAKKFAFFEVPTNKSWIGESNIYRLQSLVNYSESWVEQAIKKSISKPPWIDKEITSAEVLEVYQNLTCEIQRIEKMEKYEPTIELPTRTINRHKNIIRKAYEWIKKKIHFLRQSPSPDAGYVFEDNQL